MSILPPGIFLSFDYLRTVSCTDGTDKDVYDYIFMVTNLPDPRVNIEEWNPWNPVCYIPVLKNAFCNEEAWELKAHIR